MTRKSLKPKLNQIRAWVRQGRTDAWIAHQLEISVTDLSEFRRQHDLNPEDDAGADVDLRDEIEAEVEAAAEEASDEEASDDEDAGRDESSGEDEEADGSEAEGRPRRRRRRGRRGGRSRGRDELEATFDHGERDGYGLWLDPAVQDSPVYAENWAGKRALKVRVEADQIVIVRAGDEGDSGGKGDEESDEE